VVALLAREEDSDLMSTKPEHWYTVQEYLAIDRASDTKSEYLAGIIYAMGGASPPHVQITGNVAGELRQRLREQPCIVYSTDLRVRASAEGLYAYPDVVVVCGEPIFIDAELDTLANPLLIVEVLSPSTKNYDRGEKFESYRSNESLHEYVLVAQDRAHVEHYARQSDGKWVLAETNAIQDVLTLSSVGCELPMSEIYFKVQFKPSGAPENAG
jgi:Uma2 family endonuclease